MTETLKLTDRQIDVLAPNQSNEDARPDVVDLVIFRTGPEYGDVLAVVELSKAGALALAAELTRAAALTK